jgi:hypothetical protein
MASIDNNTTITSATTIPQSLLDKLPFNIKNELDQLELELLEGDITQKGYEKKRNKLLAPYLAQLQTSTNTQILLNQSHLNSKSIDSPNTREINRQQRRITKNDIRYHSGNKNKYLLLKKNSQINK